MQGQISRLMLVGIIMNVINIVNTKYISLKVNMSALSLQSPKHQASQYKF